MAGDVVKCVHGRHVAVPSCMAGDVLKCVHGLHVAVPRADRLSVALQKCGNAMLCWQAVLPGGCAVDSTGHVHPPL